ncbi:MAG: MarR family transcriptional regulator [Cardiobacteriaceae bacterium]|nr:MarR family transcriptional regulator [Cardiobacteriaceae bacterium]
MTVLFKDESAGYLANSMARLFAVALAESLRTLELAPAAFGLLLELWQGDGLSQRDLVERTDIEQATIANTLARMERDGLLTRTPHPHDARMQQIYLTEKAKQLEDAAMQCARQVNQQALSTLDEQEQAVFLLLMQRVSTNLRLLREGKRTG